MSRAALLLILALAASLLTGCSSAQSTYRPARVLPTELNVRYDDAFLVYAGNKQLTEGPGFEGLTDFVHCVPDARRHAESAESWGTTASVLKGLTFGFVGLGLGGLAGLGFNGKDDTAMAGLLITGVVLEAVAIATGAISLGAKAQASGHALDAVNYYNDSAGSLGGMCGAPGLRAGTPVESAGSAAR
ncbi:MAG: hypothetical protein QM765_32035 [Myxococcales bacterium]